MRVTDRRYDRDRRRLEFAYRLIRYGVRTKLIHELTGLTADRVRYLFRDYFCSEPGPEPGRPRGRPPRQMDFFRRSLQRELETAALASLLLACHLLRKARRIDTPPYEELEHFCDVFDTFVELCPATEISFEHAWYLSETLIVDDNYALVPCISCGALWIRDFLLITPTVCPSCRWPRPVDRPTRSPVAGVLHLSA